MYVNGVASISYSRVNKFLDQEQLTRGSGAFFNEAHTIFTARNGEWILNEMQRPPSSTAANGVPCSTECFSPADNAISGPATLCGSGTYTTPLRGTSGTTYTWTATPTGSFTVASGTGPTFTTANVGDANGTITLQIGGDCPLTLTRDIKVGAPEQPGLSVNIGCQDFAGTATILNYDPANTYSATTTGNVFFFSANRRSMTVTSASFNIKPEVPARWGTSICR